MQNLYATMVSGIFVDLAFKGLTKNELFHNIYMSFRGMDDPIFLLKKDLKHQEGRNVPAALKYL